MEMISEAEIIDPEMILNLRDAGEHETADLIESLVGISSDYRSTIMYLHRENIELQQRCLNKAQQTRDLQNRVKELYPLLNQVNAKLEKALSAMDEYGSAVLKNIAASIRGDKQRE